MASPEPVPLDGGGWVDLARGQVVRDGRVTAELTAREIELFDFLARRPGEDVARDLLAVEVLHQEPTSVSRAVDTAVFRLRAKIERDPTDPRQLLTVQGVGYRWVPVGAPAGRSNVPPARDALLGRAAALAELDAALEAPVVTLTGAPGIGKTTTALAFARDRTWSGGVLLVELGEARTDQELLRLVASALEVPPGEPGTAGAVGWALRHRGPMLVVLDDVDAVAAELVARLLSWRERAPAARWLLTSRSAVGLDGERIVELPTLDPGTSVALFLERARAVRAPTDEDRPAVAALCAALDGIPLAIELAASRVGALPPAQLLERLSERLRLLRRPGRDRQATLRASIEHSWELLSEEERTTFAALSAFTAPFSDEAACAVLGRPDAAERVDRLVLRSLVVRVPGGGWRLLASLRDYAAERLAERGTGEVWRRHAAWFTRGSDPLGFEILGPEGPARARRLTAEASELATVAGRFADEEPEIAARAVCCARPGLARGISDAVIDAHTYGLFERLGPGTDPLRLGVLRATCLVDRLQGAYDLARTRLTAVVASLTEPWARARLVEDLGSLEIEAGRPAEGLVWLEEAEALALSLGHERLLALVLGDRAVALKHLGRLDEAGEAYVRALQVCERAGAALVHAIAILNLGVLDAEQGRAVLAGERFREAVRRNREMGNTRSVGTALLNLGQHADELGDPRAAREHFEEALGILRRTGSRRLEGVARSNLGGLAVREGRYDDAAADLGAALDIAVELGLPRHEAVALAELAQLAWCRGDRPGAIASLRRALTLGSGARNEAFQRAFLGGLLALEGEDPAPELALAKALGEEAGDPTVGEVARVMDGLAALAAGDRSAARLALGSGSSSGWHVRFAEERLRAALAADGALPRL